ncbi:histidinol-phosphate transaminase [Bradyrhizobium sp. 31Argb]|uniref:histidinol-phosphate transaminase n=1 Tax=Bradyrhizobium sp. 31Argb TaxID=3141247 RepID=UPI003747A92B
MYERMHICQIEGYVPGLQPDSGAIKLNTNENPFPPSPRVMAHLSNILPLTLQRYPDPSAMAFRLVAARAHGVAPDQVIATNGGDELLRLALATFVDPGRAVGIVSPGYGFYSLLAGLHRAPVCDVPLTEAWQLPEETASRWNAAGAQLAFLTNPHAPCGTLFPIATIERLAASFKGVLVVDEAYVDFVDPALGYDATTLISRHQNVLLLRTLSKGYSLAGLRLGYGLADVRLIQPILHKTKDTYNVDAIAQILGAAGLDDRTHASGTWEAVRKERETLSRNLQDLNLAVGPSQANFVLVSLASFDGSCSARQVVTKLMEGNIYVRWFDTDRLRDKLRVTIGTPQENAALISALRTILGRPDGKIGYGRALNVHTCNSHLSV